MVEASIAAAQSGYPVIIDCQDLWLDGLTGTHYFFRYLPQFEKYFSVRLRWKYRNLILDCDGNFTLMTRLLSILLLLLTGCTQGECAQSVTLAWNPVTNVGVAGYNIYLGSKSSNYTAVTNVGNVTNATVSVTNNPAYFAATTIGSNGMESAYSTQVVVDTNNYETNFTYAWIDHLWVGTNLLGTNGYQDTKYALTNYAVKHPLLWQKWMLFTNWVTGTNILTNTQTQVAAVTPAPPMPK